MYRETGRSLRGGGRFIKNNLSSLLTRIKRRRSIAMNRSWVRSVEKTPGTARNRKKEKFFDNKGSTKEEKRREIECNGKLSHQERDHPVFY